MAIKLDELNIRVYLLDLTPNKKSSVQEYFIPKRLPISNTIGSKLKLMLKDKFFIDASTINEVKFKFDFRNLHDFFLSDSKDLVYKLKNNILASEHFNLLDERLKEFTNIADANSNYSKSKFLIIELYSTEQRFLFFRKLSKIHFGNKKIFSINNEIKENTSDFIYFDQYIDFAYIDKLDSDEENLFIILNKPNFEYLFQFDEFYKSNAKEFLEKEETVALIQIQEELKDSLIIDKKINKRLTRFHKSEIEINFQLLSGISNTTNQKLKYTITDKNIVIENKIAVNDLLDMVEEKIAKSEYRPNGDELKRYEGISEVIKND